MRKKGIQIKFPKKKIFTNSFLNNIAIIICCVSINFHDEGSELNRLYPVRRLQNGGSFCLELA